MNFFTIFEVRSPVIRKPDPPNNATSMAARVARLETVQPLPWSAFRSRVLGAGIDYIMSPSRRMNRTHLRLVLHGQGVDLESKIFGAVFLSLSKLQ